MQKGDNLLSIRGAERHLYDGQRSSDIRLQSIDIAAGITYALCGPSGIGKTTALEMLSLAAKPDEVVSMSLAVGKETIDLRAVMSSRRAEDLARLRGRYFGYIVQTAHLFPFLSVRENIALSQRIAGRDDAKFLNWLMDYLQITQLADSAPHHLSGGQRQRVCVARALAHRPMIVLADEPTSAVDQEVANRIVSLLSSYAKHYDAAVLIITHNTSLLEAYEVERLHIESNVSGGFLNTVISTTGATRGAVRSAEAYR